MAENTGIIQVLDELTANQIAAGEVVERPLSIVKELVENAIDAGSSRITIQVEDGGLAIIKILDNGCGISKQDIPLAFLRHATSKIQTADDLFNIHTMGFRGEALPSIGSVSIVEIASRKQGAVAGYSFVIENNKVNFIGEVGMPVGTQVTVKNLFYNTPVRKKFMKSPVLEMGYIIALVGQFILANPHIAFILQSQGKIVLNSAGRGDLQQAVISVYGRQMADVMAKVDYKNRLKVTGYVSLPPFSRGSRKYYNFFVNDRLVKSKELANIIELAYDTLLPSSRYPAVVLAVELPADSIDVNVHPAKTEIRFHDLELLTEEVLTALKTVLRPTAASIPELSTQKEAAENIAISSYNIPEDDSFIRLKEINRQTGNRFEPSKNPDSDHIEYPKTQDVLKSKHTGQTESNFAAILFASMTGVVPSNINDEKAKPTELGETVTEPSANPVEERITNKESIEATSLFNALLGGTSSTSAIPEADTTAKTVEDNIFKAMRSLGQIDGTYIAAVAEETLYLIDQHAAHERVRFEKFYKAYREQEQSSTMLALPVTIELSPVQKGLLINNITNLADLGFIVEYFGNNTFILRGVPTWFWQQEQDGGYKEAAEEFFITVLEKISEDKNIDITAWNREQLFTFACKSAVKANQYLTDADINWLFCELAQAEKPLTCPHGRPVAIKITKEEISRRFMRG